MSRARWAAWGLAVSLGLTAGCCNLFNRPFFCPSSSCACSACSGGACGACSGGACGLECGNFGGEVPVVTGGPVLQDYGTPPVVSPPPVSLPPAPATVPPLAPPPQRLVPQPAQPEPYRP
jgi:hypothetical protein